MGSCHCEIKFCDKYSTSLDFELFSSCGRQQTCAENLQAKKSEEFPVKD